MVLSYERHLSSLLSDEDLEPEFVEEKPTPDDKGKEASNLIVLLSELYNFQVISSVLVFDIIRALLNREVQEFQVELLLKIVRSKYALIILVIIAFLYKHNFRFWTAASD